jgi:hypothetical protein
VVFFKKKEFNSLILGTKKENIVNFMKNFQTLTLNFMTTQQLIEQIKIKKSFLAVD